MKIELSKNLLYEFIIVFLIIIFPLLHYPNIYGVDSFGVLWMAQAILDGALFSEKTWLIHPASYFGFYPFSHRPIGIPLITALLIWVTYFLSFGIFGISEAVLILDILLIILTYLCSKSLAKTIFKESWCRLLFITTILFSHYMLSFLTMTISTRIIITILALSLLNINLKILNRSIKKYKAISLMILIYFFGIFSHKLWIGLFIYNIILVVIFFFEKKGKIRKIFIFLIPPLSVLAFFIGLNIFSMSSHDFLLKLESTETFSPYFTSKTLIGINLLLIWYYFWQVGIILTFLPLGLIVFVYEISHIIDNSNLNDLKSDQYQNFLQKFYLIISILPFCFLISTTFYCIVIFLPILVIFSIYGVIYIKKVLQNYSKILIWLTFLSLFLLTIIYSYIKTEVSVKINLWYIYAFSLTIFIMISFFFIIVRYKPNFNLKNKYNIYHLKKTILFIILTLSVISFETTSIETNLVGISDSKKPWENNFLTDQEIQLINFFNEQDINGLIFTTGIPDNRIGGVGGLPAISGFGPDKYGKALYYDLITPEEVYQMTYFSVLNLMELKFFNTNGSWYERNPSIRLNEAVMKLNSSNLKDMIILRIEYNIQYVISVKELYLDEVENGENWVLIRSFYQTELKPVFSTEHMMVWEVKI